MGLTMEVFPEIVGGGGAACLSRFHTDAMDDHASNRILRGKIDASHVVPEQ